VDVTKKKKEKEKKKKEKKESLNKLGVLIPS